MPNKPETGELPAVDPWTRLLAGGQTGEHVPGFSLPPGSAPGVLFIISQEGTLQLLEGTLPLAGCPAFEEGGALPLERVLEEEPGLIAKARQALGGIRAAEITRCQGRRWQWQFHPLPGTHKRIPAVLGVVYDLGFQQQLWHQGAMMQALAALRRTRSLEDMLPVIAGQLREQLGIDRAAVVLGSPPESPYQLEYLQEWGQESSWDQPPIRRELTDPVRIGGLYGGGPDSVGGSSQAVTHHQQGFPLIVGKQLLGALWVERPEPFSPAEARLAGELADMYASALQRARQHSLTERRLERLSALHAIDQAISGNFNLSLTLHIILEQVVSQLDVDAADIILIDPDTLEVTNTEGQGFRYYQPQSGITHVRHDLAWRVLQRRELVALPDLYRESPTLLRGRTFALEGFKSYFGIPLVAKGRVLGVMEVFHRQPLRVDEEWADFLRALGTQAAIAMDNAALVENLRRSNLNLDLAYNSTLEGWVRALALRDQCTGDHTNRVVENTLKLARAVGIPEREMLHIQRGALLHDIGKLAVPDSVLNKEGPLDEEEWALMRRHPILAREILDPIEFLRPALPIPTSHHERWNGSGYPQGLSGGQIPLEARVFAVVDVWDALGSPRPYREAWAAERVHDYIRGQAGSHFDPGVVEVWEKVFNIR